MKIENATLRRPSGFLGEARGGGSGAVVIGADYRGLGIVRSLGRRGIPVTVLYGDSGIGRFSRYTSRALAWPRGQDAEHVAFLLELSRRFRLEGATLFATTDDTSRLLSVHRRTLESVYRVTSPPWECSAWAYDKEAAYSFAASVGVVAPRTWYPKNRDEVASVECTFPVILKPANRYRTDRFTNAKAWPCNNRSALLAGYDLARTMVPASIIMIQELIPGDGRVQYSYAALCQGGIPIAEIVARRLRQYPIDFGKFSTFVETVESPEILTAGRSLVSHSRYSGLIEVEFKYDSNDGQYKLLDVNPRVWGWHTICSAEGLDFVYLAWLLARGDPMPEIENVSMGVVWQYLFPDLLSCGQSLARGLLPMKQGRQGFAPRRQHAIFAWDDFRPILFSGLALVAKLTKRTSIFAGRGSSELETAGVNPTPVQARITAETAESRVG